MTPNDAHKKAWSGNEIRETFLRFFESKGHRRVRSSSLVPHGDPTLLFTNAGMNQFKDGFLGLEQRDYKRATSAQKCVRAGGKHNDLENVGFTKRHHTFFEMLGNFSFGDYFKKEAIAYAWELVTSSADGRFGIPKDKLYVTIFGGAEVAPGNKLGEDEEARRCWLEQQVPAERIVAVPGLKENFWAMGDTGPCGPCSEIHYDMGPAASDLGHADCKFPCDCGRFVEIWNLVFMEFNRDASGTLTRLPKPGVDTGMGLERLAAVLQGVISNYDTDLFQPLIAEIGLRAGYQYGQEARRDVAVRVIADHSRAATFLVTDGVLPSNEGRGYVLRKILRRAIDFGRALGLNEPFLFVMAERVVHLMKEAYPELGDAVKNTMTVIRQEEERYQRAVVPALQRFDAYVRDRVQGAQYSGFVSEPSGIGRLEEAITIAGQDLFFAYDTLGLRPDFMRDVLGHRGWKISPNADAEFEGELEKQRKKARASWKGGVKEAANPAYAKLAETYRTEPDFYYGTTSRDCRIEAIILTGGAGRADLTSGAHRAGTRRGPVNELKAGEEGEIVLDRTVIYAESGGQVADTGAFYDNSESQHLAEVTGAYYPVAGLIAHKVVAKETLRVGDRVAVIADATRREHIMRNHTGTHLVHAALRNILGTHVKQSGSLNAPDRLRFDFSHFARVEPEELRDIEQQVNEEILQDAEIETEVASLEDALNSGALAFFGDKYPEHNVRVVTIPDPRSPLGFYSKELCGGTHVRRAGEIGVLKLIGEQSVAAGVRRLEAVTGLGALEHYERAAQLLSQLGSQLNVGEDAILATVEKLTQTARQLGRQLEAQKRQGALSQLDELAAQVQLVKGVKVIAAEVLGVDREGLRQLVDSLRQKIGSGVVALGTPENGQVALITGVTKDLVGKIHAGKLIQALAKQVGGTGGGRPDLAEAGGKDTSALKSALQALPSLIEPLL